MVDKRKEVMSSSQLPNNYAEVKHFDSSMGVVGLIGKDSQEFCKLIKHMKNIEHRVFGISD